LEEEEEEGGEEEEEEEAKCELRGGKMNFHIV